MEQENESWGAHRPLGSVSGPGISNIFRSKNKNTQRLQLTLKYMTVSLDHTETEQELLNDNTVSVTLYKISEKTNIKTKFPIILDKIQKPLVRKKCQTGSQD